MNIILVYIIAVYEYHEYWIMTNVGIRDVVFNFYRKSKKYRSYGVCFIIIIIIINASDL